MVIRKALSVMILIATCAAFFIGHVNATYTILVFAPQSYAGCICVTGPNGPQPKPFYGYASSIPSGLAHYNNDGTFGSSSVLGPNGFLRFTIDTGSYLYNGTTTTLASVSASAWMMYGISGYAGFHAVLEVSRWRPGLPMIVWTNYHHPTGIWGDSVSGWKTRSVDLEINPYTTDPSGNRFNLTYGFYYRARMYIWGVASAAGSSVAVEIGEFKEIVFHSQGSEWNVAPQQLFIDPSISPTYIMPPDRGACSGTGFAPNALVYIYYDDRLVNTTLSDGYGNFTTSFTVSETVKGPHMLKAIDALENMCAAPLRAVVPVPPLLGDVTGPTYGLPDGIVNMRDIGAVCTNFGKTDPNVEPPRGPLGQISKTDIAVAMTTAATTLTAVAAPLCIHTRHRKKENNKRVSEGQN